MFSYLFHLFLAKEGIGKHSAHFEISQPCFTTLAGKEGAHIEAQYGSFLSIWILWGFQLATTLVFIYLSLMDLGW